ncbi:efflux transporter outer membrane subunit [Limisphaera sp. 4302-co]
MLRLCLRPIRLYALSVLGVCGWLLLVGAGTGCLPAVRQAPPAVRLPDQFRRSGTVPLPDRWWRSFEDPVLAELIEQALREQPGLLAVWARLEQAEALARKAGAELVPAMDLRAQGSRTYERAADAHGRYTVRQRADLFLGAAASYEVDLWGRVRSLREAALQDARTAEAQLQVSALTLSARIAGTWFEWAAQQALVALWERQAQLQSNMLVLVEARFERGQVGAADVLRQRQVLESVHGSLAVARAEAEVLRQQLSVLVGGAPGGPLPQPPPTLPPLPPLPQTGVPADLILRRPDLQAGYRALLAADARLAAAIADRLPRLSLSAQAGVEGRSSRVLLDQWLAALAANLTAPVLDGGARRAEVAYRRAVVAERFHQFRQAALEAVAEVETALVREQQLTELLASLRRQLELADRTVERLRDSYSKGTVDYLRVLDALLTQQSLQRAEWETRRDLLLQRVTLCRALAGGWELPRPGPAGSEVAGSAAAASDRPSDGRPTL